MTEEWAEPAPVVAIAVPSALHGERVDRAVALLAETSRAVASHMVAAGAVQVDGAVVTSRRSLLRSGQSLRIELPPPPATGPVPDPSISFVVVYEDEHVVVVDKPAGLVVHHGSGHRSGTLIDGLVARYPELADLPAAGVGEADRPGIVHRLDKDTSGLLVVARTVTAYKVLSEQMRTHQARRSYTALVHGVPADRAGVIDAPIGRSARTPTRMAVAVTGRPARTHYRIQQVFSEPLSGALLDVSLETGRTHQVRVHLAAIGHPVVGDSRYSTPGNREVDRRVLGVTRQFLHARQLTVTLPGGSTATWESPLAADLEAVLGSWTACDQGPTG